MLCYVVTLNDLRVGIFAPILTKTIRAAGGVIAKSPFSKVKPTTLPYMPDDCGRELRKVDCVSYIGYISTESYVCRQLRPTDQAFGTRLSLGCLVCRGIVVESLRTPREEL